MLQTQRQNRLAKTGGTAAVNGRSPPLASALKPRAVRYGLCHTLATESELPAAAMLSIRLHTRQSRQEKTC